MRRAFRLNPGGLLRRGVFASRAPLQCSVLQCSVLNQHVRTFADKIDSGSIVLERSTTLKEKLPKEELKFGQSFTDHMLEVNWDINTGWDKPVIKPYGDFKMSPAASVLHYAIECFEGMKAYIDKNGKIRMFRPDMNMKRMQSSANRLVLPPFDEGEWLACIKELLKVDKSWIPVGEGYSLYIRPTYISTHPCIGVATPAAAKLYCILSPVGPYYPSGFAPITLLADPNVVRAWPGGTGDTKIGGNYAMGIGPAKHAIEKGYSQVLWLYGEKQEVTEVGTMNQFFYWVNKAGEEELVTASLADGTILPGVTRNSIIALTESWGIKVSERTYYLKEVLGAIEEGRMLEAFGAGTAAIVSPVEGFGYDGKDYKIPLDKNDPTQKAGPLTRRILDELQAIQYGNKEHEWSVVVD